MQTKEQQRSSFALERINKIYNNGVDKNTANFIVGAPTMILDNGLGQTMAFLLSKNKGATDKKDKHRFVFNAIRDHCIEKEINDEQVFDSISNYDANEYLAKQQEALAMLQWLKRYARAFQQDGNQ